MRHTKCTCDDEHDEHEEHDVELGEYLERLFIPSIDNCGSTIAVYENMCLYSEHHSNRESGEHDDVTTMCHYCVLKFKQDEKGYYITEYTNGSNWDEAP